MSLFRRAVCSNSAEARSLNAGRILRLRAAPSAQHDRGNRPLLRHSVGTAPLRHPAFAQRIAGSSRSKLNARLRTLANTLGAGGTITLAGILACGLTLLTTAAFTDQANLNLGAAGIGSSPFDLAVVGATGTPSAGQVVQADTAAGVEIPLDGGASLVPGSVLTSAPIVAFNNSHRNSAKLCVAVQSRDGVVAPAYDISHLLAFTVTDFSSGSPVVVGTASSAIGTVFDLGQLQPRGSAGLAADTPYSAGDTGSERTFTVTVSYPDTEASEAFSRGQASLRLTLTAHSDLTGGCS